jgi:inosine-uridine nucleoside N-ribohydrolase
MLNAVERSVFDQQNCSDMIACDQMLTAAILRPEIVLKSILVHMTIELHGHHTRGQAVVDHLKSNHPNVIVITKIREDIFKEIMLTAADITYIPR